MFKHLPFQHLLVFVSSISLPPHFLLFLELKLIMDGLPALMCLESLLYTIVSPLENLVLEALPVKLGCLFDLHSFPLTLHLLKLLLFFKSLVRLGHFG